MAGGHLQDGHGDVQACVYDYRRDVWTALPPMDNGRWYPSAITLPDGTILVASGSYFDGLRATPNNAAPQIWTGRGWRTLEDKVLSLYPRWHLLPDGLVFVTGTDADSFYLDPRSGTWKPAPSRAQNARDYAPSVMYDVGKIVYIGGGNDPDTQMPTAAVETIDCTVPLHHRRWVPAATMHHRRRHHNATILPDGTVLVTGGTAGKDFNDLSPGQPVHAAELWDPAVDQWTELAAEEVDRCYHGTAVLLPDGTVLSAGGGEGGSDPNVAHREAQIFRPPYLFQGPRPRIRAAPVAVAYGQEFSIEISGDIRRLSCIRLSSVTHAFNQNQLINFLEFTRRNKQLKVLAPERSEVCPPRHYMLFVLSPAGVPSLAHIFHLGEQGNRYDLASPRNWIGVDIRAEDPGAHYNRRLRERDQAIKHQSKGTHVVVGLTSRCPYGLGSCWSAAFRALEKIEGVEAVGTVPNRENSTADVYLRHRGLPALEKWPGQIAESAKGSYHFRGIEVTIEGTLRESHRVLELTAPGRPAVELRPLSEGVKIQWDYKARRVRPASVDELGAYTHLREMYRQLGREDKFKVFYVTGPLSKARNRWILHVRTYRE